MEKILLLAIVFSILILPNMAMADQVFIKATMANIISAATIIATSLIVIFWIIVGILFLYAQGAPEKLAFAKRALYMALIGTALVILASVAGTIIGNALLLGV